MGFTNIFQTIEELYMDTEGTAVMEPKNPCEICGKGDDKKPMCFQTEPWCSENHRKQIVGEEPQKRH